MPHLVAAPDKFRGTASAGDVAAAMGRAAERAGWTAHLVPMADGGEGTIDVVGAVVGGDVRRATVSGPLGEPLLARWLLLPDAAARRLGAVTPAALVEAAEAVGRQRLPRPRGDDPVTATTEGVGHLVLAAAGDGAREVIVTVGGTATTDGGSGALAAIGRAGGLRGLRLTVGWDVQTPFRRAAEIYGPQKGADPDQVVLLGRRLEAQASRYRERYGVDVDLLAGAGAGGGLAGGLVAAGGRLVAGFELVARAVGLRSRLEAADLVATGEGLLDATSFAGKVVGGVVATVGRRVPVVAVVGDAALGAIDEVRAMADERVEVLRLVPAVGRRRAIEDTARAIEELLAARLADRSVAR